MANKRKRTLAPAQTAIDSQTIAVDKKAAYRSVRPRPLRYDEKIRILWPGDPSLELLDGGAFAKWLRDSPEQHADTSYVSSNTQGAKRIQVPNYRILPKRDLPSQPTAPANATLPDSNEEAAYIRLRTQTQDEIDSKIDYDLDSDDEQWLSNRKAKTSGETLGKDDLERLIDGFEKAKHDVMELRQSEWRRQGPDRAVVPPDKLEPNLLYPVSSAIRDFGNAFPSLTVRAVHNYWAKKAGASKLPLLQRFWYDKPWGRLADLAKLTQQDSSSDEEDGIPFQGKDSPTRETHHRKKAMDLVDVEDRLHHARIDLEKIRTIADQIRRREKVKKRMVVAWRTTWQQKVALANRPTAKKGKKAAKKNAKLVEPVKLTKLLASGKAKNAAVKGMAAADAKESPKGSPSSEMNKLLKPGATKAAKRIQPLKARKYAKKQAAMQVADAEELPSAAAKKRAAAVAATTDQRKGKNIEKQASPAAKAVLADSVPVDLAEEALRTSSKDINLPAGFSVSVRSTPGKPRGYVEWYATCKHGENKLDRMSKVAQLFEQHGKCRPDWQKFMRGPKEGAKGYQARLRQSFSFTQSEVLPEEGLKSRDQAKQLSMMQGKISKAQKPSRLAAKSKVQAAGKKARPVTRSSMPTAELQRKQAGKKPVKEAKEAARKPVTRKKPAPKTASDSLPGPSTRPPRQTSQVSVDPVSATAERQSREPSVEYFEALESVTSSSSSGSDTFVPADSDLYNSEESSQAPSTRFGGMKSGRNQGGAQKQAAVQWSDRRFAAERQHSDASSLSEGSWPSLFSQDQFLGNRGKPSGPVKVQGPGKAARKTKQKGRSIVAAARRRARQAIAR